MNVFEIRNAVLEKLNQNAEEFKGWEISCLLDSFGFDYPDDESMENYLMYRVSNHEQEKSFRFHHQIDENGEHHCWWYNFDNVFETYSDKIAIDEMVSFISNQIRGVK